MSDATNDNGSSIPIAARVPDPHGQAALLLVESLIHGLLARSGLSVDEAVEIVQIAIDVQHETSHDRGNSPALETACGHLLSAIAASLAIDRPAKGTPKLDLDE